MGSDPETIPALPQVGLRVTPTQSIYNFENQEIHVTLAFLRPALPSDLEAMALPLTYLTWQVRSVDGKPHAVSLFQSTSAQIAVNRPNEAVEWKMEKAGALTTMHAGTVEQAVLASAGDDHRINWGYIYAAASTAESQSAIGGDKELLSAFIVDGKLPEAPDTRMPRAANDHQPIMVFAFDLGSVSKATMSRGK